MAKYVCSPCGSVYDEAKGIPESGVKPIRSGRFTRDLVCPFCGAVKQPSKKKMIYYQSAG